MELQQIDITGCRLIGAISDVLGHAGPKHHAVVLGQCSKSGEVYLAENNDFGYQLETMTNFKARYDAQGEIKLFSNSGSKSNLQVAKDALAEVVAGGKGKYNLISNNCEFFVNRAMHDNSVSSQVVNTFGVFALIAAGVYLYKKSK
ncbi:hypothetical protein CEQ50_17105 [Vibrio anguillarum]|uniref:lecithin retinol acyltransferase family protein n=1 Tax=Vibrio anguillarum TaxID=55601 RepID=UPI000B540BBE|nr:lecithin retinol acyltransferase family protein [Vibrio anguillarum]ASG09223.1 hypothetical protein CEQ50_17105 [Vibrio anguillarum]